MLHVTKTMFKMLFSDPKIKTKTIELTTIHKINKSKYEIQNLPDDIINIIYHYIFFIPTNKEDLQTAIKLWNEDKTQALYLYDDISL